MCVAQRVRLGIEALQISGENCQVATRRAHIQPWRYHAVSLEINEIVALRTFFASYMHRRMVQVFELPEDPIRIAVMMGSDRWKYNSGKYF